jgi:hypothetical protein
MVVRLSSLLLFLPVLGCGEKADFGPRGCRAVTAGVLGGIVLFKGDFTEQYYESQSFIAT